MNVGQMHMNCLYAHACTGADRHDNIMQAVMQMS